MSLPFWTQVEVFLTRIPGMAVPLRKWHQLRKNLYIRRWERLRKQNPESLRNFEARVFSQFGEDGILAEVFRRIGAGARFCVEFGVEDGAECCSRNLLENDGWRGLLLEGSPEHAEAACCQYAGNPRVRVEEAFLTAEIFSSTSRNCEYRNRRIC